MQASPFVQLRELDSAIREIAKAQLAIKTTQEQLARRWRDLFIRGARRCDGSVTAQIAAVVDRAVLMTQGWWLDVGISKL